MPAIDVFRLNHSMAFLPGLQIFCLLLADCVVKLFCPFECVRLIQDLASMRNVDSRIHSLRFDSCVFLFYSFSSVTFATWGNSGIVPYEGIKNQLSSNV